MPGVVEEIVRSEGESMRNTKDMFLGLFGVAPLLQGATEYS